MERNNTLRLNMSCLIYEILNTIVTILFKVYLLGIIIFQTAVDFTLRFFFSNDCMSLKAKEIVKYSEHFLTAYVNIWSITLYSLLNPNELFVSL